ncbi:MAG: serine/threonine-protein kinase [Marinicella sp.]|nr:protein kinase [Xanthomonadales bacterium]
MNFSNNKKLWQQANSLYEQSLALKKSERSTFVLHKTTGNDELRTLVQRMLQAETDEGFMQNQPGVEVNEKIRQDEQLVFGHFRIVKKIAVGGMGRIYQAHYLNSDVHVFVALKLIRRELLNDDLSRRFDNEKAILGKLKHHNIAALLDAGVIEDTPYIATEWIEGVPVDEYTKQRQLSLNEVLRLFLQVCSAVEYAHNQLIIHRDLKPANILIDNHHQVKLLDFGIAKLIDIQDGRLTQTQVFTPDYAAPEQINGEVCTAATDIYALGVLLFELLIGDNRFAHQELSVAEKIKAITEPKTRFTSEVMRQNQHPLAQKVKGALDTIINQAMHADPERRYQSVHELISDIKRFQQHLPISALGDGFFYRSKMFFKRHTWSSLMALLLLVSLTGGWFYSNQQRKQAVQAQHLAQAEAEKSQQMLNFFKTLLSTASPLVGGSTQITAQKMFEISSEKFDLKTINDQALRAEIAGQIAEIYGEISANDLKIKYNNEALKYYEARLPEHAPEYLSRHLSSAIALRNQNQYEAALQQLTDAYRKVKFLSLPASLEAQVLVNFAEFHRSLNHPEQALDFLSQAESLAHGVDDTENMGKIRYYQYLLLQNQLPPEESERYLTEATEFFSAAYEGVHPNLLAAKNSLAMKYKVEGKYREATALYDVIHQENIEIYGTENQNHLINQADSYFYLGQFATTLDLIDRAITVIENNELGQGFSLMAAKVVKSRALLELGENQAADRLLSEAIDYFAPKLPADHVLMLTLKTYRLDWLVKSNRVDELDIDVKRLVADMDQLLNDANDIKRRYVNTLMVSGVYYWRMGENDQALRLITQARQTLAPITLKQEWNYWLLEAVYLQLEKVSGKSIDGGLFDEAMAQLKVLLPANHWYHGLFEP